MHGFSSATTAHDIAEDDDGRDLIVLYVGDFDPSGMFMSEEDLPARFDKYDGDHIKLKRIALTVKQLGDCRLSRQPIRRKTRATNGSSTTTGGIAGNSTPWTRTICATASSSAIRELIEPVAWNRCEVVNRAEQEFAQDHSRKVGRAMTFVGLPPALTPYATQTRWVVGVRKRRKRESRPRSPIVHPPPCTPPWQRSKNTGRRSTRCAENVSAARPTVWAFVSSAQTSVPSTVDDCRDAAGNLEPGRASD